MELWKNTVEELMMMLSRADVTSEEVYQAYYERINRYDELIRSFLSLQKLTEVKLKPNSIPFAVKDNILVKGRRTTCGSKMLWNYISPFTATAVEHLQKKNMTMIGKTNLDEFSMGSTTENSSYFPTKNPWDIKRVPGGSSGGSAAAVSAGFVPFALGSDTGGSVRQPAAFCGVVGFKPSYGLVSRNGLVAFASSFDQIGTLTRSVRDAALITEIISGDCHKDSTKKNFKKRYLHQIENKLDNMKFLIIEEMVSGIYNSGIRKRFNDVIDLFKWLGVQIVPVSIPLFSEIYSVYTILTTAEASSNLARYDGLKYGLKVKNEKVLEKQYRDSRDSGFGEEVKSRLFIGTFNLSYKNFQDYYLKAMKIRNKITEEINTLLKSFDAIISPTVLSIPGEIGETQTISRKESYDNNTVPANISGVPAISVPMGMVNNLPTGLQIMTARFSEEKLFQIARTYEKTAGFFEDGHYPYPHMEWFR